MCALWMFQTNGEVMNGNDLGLRTTFEHKLNSIYLHCIGVKTEILQTHIVKLKKLNMTRGK